MREFPQRFTHAPWFLFWTPVLLQEIAVVARFVYVWPCMTGTPTKSVANNADDDAAGQEFFG